MPGEAVSDAKLHLFEAHALLKLLITFWKDDLSLKAQAVIAGEHVKIALDALGCAEELLSTRQESAE